MDQKQSKIEAMLLDPAFDYLQPYFYENPFALRCELGQGAGEAFSRAARRRAEEIWRILFPRGADAVFFSQWITDWADTGAPEAQQWDDPDAVLALRLRKETEALRFLLEMQMRRRHAAVKGLKTYLEPEDPDYEAVRRNRIVCWSDGRGFDDLALIERQLADRENLEIGLVSFENECILSVYDDRGCDVVFADAAHLRAFYDRLRPYFLDYDLAEMERRRERTDEC